MTIAPARRTGVSPDSGFVLVGVVMFILVLTILGLSLFSLSGYEAQFFNASAHRQNSYYGATGGIERAKWVVTQTDSMDNVKNDMPEGVIFTTARQGPDFDTADSTGAVDWDGPDPVWIRVLAEDRGMKTYIEARFTPAEPEQIYKRLITCYEGVTATTRPERVMLFGPVWQNNTDLTWMTQVGVSPGPVLTGGVHMPDVLGFYAAKLPGAQVVTPVRSGSSSEILDIHLDVVTSSAPVFYRTTGLIKNSDEDGATRIYVRGTVVWMVPDGFDVDTPIQVHGGPSDRLIVVARRPGHSVGIHIDAIDDSPVVTTPIILVSDAGIQITPEWNATTIDMNLPYITMFAKDVILGGPQGARTLTLSHNPSLDHAVLQPLYDAGALPNTGVGRTLTLQAGTWRQLPTTGL